MTSAWAVVDGDSIIVASILCGEHANDPAVLNRVHEEVKGDLIEPRGLVGFSKLPEGDAVLANDCVECKRVAPQPDLPAAGASSILTTWDLTQFDPEQDGEAEESVDYVNEKMDAMAPVPWGLEILSEEDVYSNRGMMADDSFDGEDMVTLKLGVEEKIWYPAEVQITRARYEAVLGVFPQLKRHNLPLGLILKMAKAEGATVVYNERRSDIQGQEPVGPVEEGDSDHGNQ